MARTRRRAVQHATILRELEVVEVFDVTPGMRRVRLTGDQLGAFGVSGGTADPFVSAGFDDHVKLLVPIAGQERPPLPVQGPDRLEWSGAGGRPVAKDYTPRFFDPERRLLDLDFVRHGEGFASGWAERVNPGEPAWIVGPTRSLLMPSDVDAFVAAGDETALPAIGRLLEQWPDGLPGHVVVHLDHEDHAQDLVCPDGVSLTQVVGAHAWFAALEELPWPSGEVFCWIASETSLTRDLRKWVSSERGVPRDCLDATGYWRA